MLDDNGELQDEIFNIIASKDELGDFYDDIEGAIEKTIEWTLDVLCQKGLLAK